MKEKCNICEKVLKSKRGLFVHFNREHSDEDVIEYKLKYGYLKKCSKCSSILGKGNKSGFCSNCRDRSGINNSFYGKSHDDKTIKAMKEKCSIASKKKWEDTEYRKKVIEGTSKPRKESFKKEQSERIKQWYIDNPNQREIRSDYMKKYWEEGIIEPNINSINESKDEIKLRSICENLFDKEKVRKTTIKIDNKWYYPDIKIGKKFIIEFYGDYWHANPKKYNSEDLFKHGKSAKDVWEYDKKRIKALEENGYEVYIVWQSEFIENKELVIKNIEKWYYDKL